MNEEINEEVSQEEIAEQLIQGIYKQLQELYISTKRMFNEYFLASDILNVKPDDTPFKTWKLEELITYCLNYDYKSTNIQNYELALNELYQRQKSKSGFYLIKDVRVVSNRVHGISNCLGLFLWPREDLRSDMCSIFICDDRYNRRHGYSLISENNKNIGVRYLHTYFHEAQHENQFSNVARFMQNGRILGKDIVATIFSLFYSSQDDYYSRFVEFDAEATAINRMFKLYKQGIINDNNDIIVLYEHVVNFLNNYKINKVVNSVNKLLPTLVTAIDLNEPDKVRSLTQGDVNAFVRKLKDTYHDIIGMKAEYEQYFLNTLPHEFKTKMKEEAEKLALLKQSKYEYNTRFLEKMKTNPYQVDTSRSQMFLISYMRAKTYFDNNQNLKQEENQQY